MESKVRSHLNDSAGFCLILCTSVEFVQVVRQQHHSHLEGSLLDSKALANAHILELGFAFIIWYFVF
jgi:hypothetical protein